MEREAATHRPRGGGIIADSPLRCDPPLSSGMPRKTPRQVRDELTEQRAGILADEEKSETTADEDRRFRELAHRQHGLRRQQEDILRALPQAAAIDLSTIPDDLLPEDLQQYLNEEREKAQLRKSISQDPSRLLKLIQYWRLEKEITKIEAEYDQIERAQMRRLFPESIELVREEANFLIVKIDLSRPAGEIVEDVRRVIRRMKKQNQKRQALKSDRVRRKILAFSRDTPDSRIARAVFPEDYAAGGKKRRAAVARVRYYRSRR